MTHLTNLTILTFFIILHANVAQQIISILIIPQE
jgi:hypothetical protein